MGHNYDGTNLIDNGEGKWISEFGIGTQGAKGGERSRRRNSSYIRGLGVEWEDSEGSSSEESDEENAIQENSNGEEDALDESIEAMASKEKNV